MFAINPADQLTDQHKEHLKGLLKLVRDRDIPEEFWILYDGVKAKIVASTGKQFIGINGLTRLGIEALTRAGFLFSLANYTRESSASCGITTESERENSRCCYITPQGIMAADNNFAPFEGMVMHRTPVEISQSLARFQVDYPDPSRLAFIMMQFGTSDTHFNIHSGIQTALQNHSFIALRADDRQYHDDLFLNILTYIYGCRFGIAVFERIESDDFNPNVSLEVGYMLGLGKSVCYLKDHTLKALHSDLMGKLYREFNPCDCKTIGSAIYKWMDDQGLIVRTVAK